MSQPDFADVRSLLERLPRQNPERPIRGATAAQIDQLEQDLGRSVPASLRAWYAICGGIHCAPGGLLGPAAQDSDVDIREVMSWPTHVGWAAAGWLPVAGDGNGDYYVLDTTRAHLPNDDAVFFVDQSEPDDLAYIVGSSLPRFLVFLMEHELESTGWPFDRAYVVARDPGIEAVTPAGLLPWNA
jgi:cell wall assembly regulator SMI1